MVGVQGYAVISMSNLTPGVGTVQPGGYNTASALQDAANINAALVRVNFTIPFQLPPVISIQPIRVLVNWVSPGGSPFMPDGANTHRNVFPLPPQSGAGSVDEIMDIRVARVYEVGSLPVGGRPMPPSTKIEIENRLLANRVLNAERTYFNVQFASHIGQVIRVRPYQLDEDVLGSDDVQHGTITEITFGFLAAGDLDLG